VSPPSCLSATATRPRRKLPSEPRSSPPIPSLTDSVRHFAAKLGFAIEAERSIWGQFPCLDELSLYEAVRGLSDYDLDQLETLLSALVFGQRVCQRLDTEDSLFNRVARNLCVDMRYHWRPDRSFLERPTRDQLVAIAVDCGYAEGVGRMASYKKAELVNSLIWHFESARAAAEPTPAQQKAREWLPDAMRFPAVDPDAASDPEEEPSDNAPWEDAA
jgi:ParB family transcriptional regulator, chromosome partitioning protein